MHRSSLRGCSSLCCTNQAEMYCPQNTLRRVWHPCHTHATCRDRILPRNAQNAQKVRVRVIPQNTLRRVWHPCHTHATHLIILPQMAQMHTDGQGA